MIPGELALTQIPKKRKKRKRERENTYQDVLHHPQGERPMYTTSLGRRNCLSVMRCTILQGLKALKKERDVKKCMDLESKEAPNPWGHWIRVGEDGE